MSTMTAAALEERLGVQIHEHLERQVAIPVHSSVPQRQGDVLFVPRPDVPAASTKLTAAGFPVVRGENGGNTHALHADTGSSFYTPASSGGLRLGVLTVAEGSTAILSHPEHGFMAFGPGNYVATRQREQADEIRMVQD